MSTSPTSSALIEQAQSWLRHYYNLDGEVYSLPGEVDYNFLVRVANQKQYTLKVSRLGTDQQELDFQIAILEHLRSKDLPFAVPQLVVTKEGNLVEEAKGADGQQHYLRLQSWVAGRML
ncbi:MAG: phosphotransferase, partial [Bacteroidota bacterium]